MIARSIFYPSCLKFSKQSYLIHQPFQTAKHTIIMLFFFYPQLLINVLILWQIKKYKTLCCCFQTITNDVSIHKWSRRWLNQNMLIYNINDNISLQLPFFRTQIIHFLSNGIHMLSVCAQSFRTQTDTITCCRAVTKKSYLPYNKMALFGQANKLVVIKYSSVLYLHKPSTLNTNNI